MPRLRDIKKGDLFGGGKKTDTQEVPGAAFADLEEEIDKIEKEMNELRSVYELFFMGVERNEPRVRRDALRSRIRRIREVKVNNASLKFKKQMLQARIITLENYWGRVMRQREEGTYYRDQAKVRRNEAERLAKELKAAEEAAIKAAAAALAAKEARLKAKGGKSSEPATQDGRPGLPVEGQPVALRRDGGPERATVPPRGAPSGVGRPSASSAADLTEPKLRQLYDAYVTAKKRCGEKLDLGYEDMAASLRKQVPKLIQTTGAKAIEFKVVIKKNDLGKQTAVLKALPKGE